MLGRVLENRLNYLLCFLSFSINHFLFLLQDLYFDQTCFAFKVGNVAITFIFVLISASSAVELFPLELSDPILDHIEDNRPLHIMLYTFYCNISVG